jgi:hypothetical protein
MAKKKITLETLATQMQKGFAAMNARMTKGFASVDARTESGFAAIADDIADIKRDMATKDQVIALHTQANSIERQLRDMKYPKLEDRVTAIERKVFGEIHA